MAHSHDHSHDSNYYLDQICTIASCGLLGGVAIMMFVSNRLELILAPQFWIPVLVGGIGLILMVIIRAITLWRQAGRMKQCQHNHSHDHHHHEHDLEHGHEHHHHDHDHHDHEHAHSHDHGHEHGWTPARYAILMLPIVLYFLNLPNSSFSADFMKKNMPVGELEGGGAVTSKEGVVLGIKELARAAGDSKSRTAMEGKTGRIKGIYATLGNDKQFMLYRVKINCCAADAVPVPVRIISDENITNIRPKEWVDVEGQIQFRKMVGGESYIPVLYVKSAKQVKPIAPLPDFGLDD